MAKSKNKDHLKLVKSDKPAEAGEDVDRIEQELLQELERLEDAEFLLLTGPPDWSVAIDKRAPLEARLRVLAAVRSCTLGNRSIDYLLRKYRQVWEQKLSAKE